MVTSMHPICTQRGYCVVCDVVVITATQPHSTKPEPRFCTGSNPAHSMSELHDGKHLWQWSWLEIRLNDLSSVNIPQKQFIISITKLCARKSIKTLLGGTLIILKIVIYYCVWKHLIFGPIRSDIHYSLSAKKLLLNIVISSVM